MCYNTTQNVYAIIVMNFSGKGALTMLCAKKDFGTTKNGEQVTEYTLTNSKGHSVSVINYGGIITKLIMSDSEGNKKNIVLGLNSTKEYEDLSPYFGCITGRVAGRLTDAKFSIGDTTYTLDKNDGENNLHGGLVGLDKVVWSVTEVIEKDYAELVLNYVSEDMDQGFPGTVDMNVTYRFDDEDNLTLKYQATTDKETILTLTNHTYFNLSGDLTTTILDHELTIPADKFIAIGPDSMPIAVKEVEGTYFDFTKGRIIGADINKDDEQLKNGTGYDHPFMLNGNDGEKIVLKDPKTGRSMAMTTNEDCVVCYTGNFLDKQDYVYDNIPVPMRGGVCLETQYYPDAINAEFLPTKTLKPGEVYSYQTTFSFKY